LKEGDEREAGSGGSDLQWRRRRQRWKRPAVEAAAAAAVESLMQQLQSLLRVCSNVFRVL